MNEDMKIGHLLEDRDNEGNRISIQWDKKDGEDWIIIKDQSGKVIMKVQKMLWENQTAGFTPQVRDSIMWHCCRCYG